MVVESGAGRVAAVAVVLLAIWSAPLVRPNLERLFLSPAYDDSSLVTIDRDTVHRNSAYGTVQPYVMNAWRERSHSFDHILPLERWLSPEGLHTERIAEGLIEQTGVLPWRGRLLHFGREREAVASFEWARGDANWIGKDVTLRYATYRIVGIMPPRFRLLSRQSEFWVALPTDSNNLEFVGTLKPGVSVQAATADLRDISRKAKHFGTQKLEVVTLRHNRQDDLWFPISLLKWNVIFVLFLAARGWFKYLRSGKRDVEPKYQARFLGLLIGKTCLVLSPLVLVWILFVDPEVQQYLTGMNGWSIPVFFWVFLLAAWGLTLWSLADHRNRCRTCLQHLRMPVNRGSYSSLVIDRPATESICIYGHGTLYVPGTHLLNLDSVAWTANREMWQELTV